MKKIVLYLAICCLQIAICSQLRAQVGINSTGAPAVSSAGLDVNFTNKGTLITRMTTAQKLAIASPAVGLLVYDTDCGIFSYFNGTRWMPLGAVNIPTPGTITGTGSHCIDTTGISFSISPVSGATSYLWTVPSGAIIASGQGTRAISVNLGHTAASGDVCVSAINNCGSSIPKCLPILIFSSQPDAPVSAGTPTNDGSNDITWYWSNNSTGITTFQWDTLSVGSTYTPNPNNPGNSLPSSYSQLTINSLRCGKTYTLYLWAINFCGVISEAGTIQAPPTNACPTGPGTPPPVNPCSDGYTFIDGRDNQNYYQVQIGTQCWMAQNLNYGTYADVTTPQAPGTKFCQTISGANDPTCVMGGLYEWDNMMNYVSGCDGTCNDPVNCTDPGDNPVCSPPIQGLCPVGWHVPSHFEWTLMENSINSVTDFPYDESTQGDWLGTQEGAQLKSNSGYWTSPNCCDASCNLNICNSTGFTVLPGGYSGSGSLNVPGDWAFFWTATESEGGYAAWNRVFNYSYASLLCQNGDNKTFGFSVRCVKD
jgi:uncharacterized protein (TIGR02145 family)